MCFVANNETASFAPTALGLPRHIRPRAQDCGVGVSLTRKDRQTFVRLRGLPPGPDIIQLIFFFSLKPVRLIIATVAFMCLLFALALGEPFLGLAAAVVSITFSVMAAVW